MSGREDKRRREKAKKKKKSKKAKMMSDDQIQAATRKELQNYQEDNSDIFDVDFSNALRKIRTDFIKQQAVFEAEKRTRSNIDDDDDSDDDEEDEGNGSDEDDEEADEDEEEDDDDEDSGSDDDGYSGQKRKRQSSRRNPKKKLLKAKRVKKQPSPPLQTPPRSVGTTPKSPTVANPLAVSALLRPRGADLTRVAKSAQCLAKRFVRGGNQN